MKTQLITMKKSNKTIVLMGTVHVAEKYFYDTLIEKVEELHSKGFKFLLEGVDAHNEELTNYVDSNKEFAESLGLCCQKDELDSCFNNKNHILCDLTAETLELLDPNVFKFTQEEHNLKMKKGDYRIALSLTNFMLKYFARDSVLLDSRNMNVVIEAFKNLATEDSIAIVYGEAHIHGIIKLFKKYGFEIKEKEYIKAI